MNIFLYILRMKGSLFSRETSDIISWTHHKNLQKECSRHRSEGLPELYEDQVTNWMHISHLKLELQSVHLCRRVQAHLASHHWLEETSAPRYHSFDDYLAICTLHRCHDSCRSSARPRALRKVSSPRMLLRVIERRRFPREVN